MIFGSETKGAGRTGKELRWSSRVSSTTKCQGKLRVLQVPEGFKPFIFTAPRSSGSLASLTPHVTCRPRTRGAFPEAFSRWYMNASGHKETEGKRTMLPASFSTPPFQRDRTIRHVKKPDEALIFESSPQGFEGTRKNPGYNSYQSCMLFHPPHPRKTQVGKSLPRSTKKATSLPRKG